MKRVGDIIGNWKVVEVGLVKNVGSKGKKLSAVRCECQCSRHTQRIIAETELDRGRSCSCGCIRSKRGHKVEKYVNCGYVFSVDNSKESLEHRSHKGFKYEHRIVAEKILGRKLLPNEVVHHKDFNRSNNSPDNLMVLTNKEHSRLHSLLRDGKEITEEAVKCGDIYCVKCHKKLKNWRRKHNMCRKCYNEEISKRIPNKETLEELRKGKTLEEIGRMFGVTGTSVHKWEKRYGI